MRVVARRASEEKEEEVRTLFFEINSALPHTHAPHTNSVGNKSCHSLSLSLSGARRRYTRRYTQSSTECHWWRPGEGRERRPSAGWESNGEDQGAGPEDAAPIRHDTLVERTSRPLLSRSACSKPLGPIAPEFNRRLSAQHLHREGRRERGERRREKEEGGARSAVSTCRASSGRCCVRRHTSQASKLSRVRSTRRGEHTQGAQRWLRTTSHRKASKISQRTHQRQVKAKKKCQRQADRKCEHPRARQQRPCVMN